MTVWLVIDENDVYSHPVVKVFATEAAALAWGKERFGCAWGSLDCRWDVQSWAVDGEAGS